jgi:hypothetical protein
LIRQQQMENGFNGVPEGPAATLKSEAVDAATPSAEPYTNLAG